MSEERLAETIERLHRLVEPMLEREGLELVDLELKRAPRRHMLRVTIDRADRQAYRGSVVRTEDTPLDEEVSIDDCTRIARELSPLLDVEDIIPTAYTLEVTSPGVNRTLKTPRHFRLALGCDVRVKTRTPIAPTKDTFFIARLVEVSEESIFLETKAAASRGQAHKPSATGPTSSKGPVDPAQSPRLEIPFRLIAQANIEYRF